MLHAMCKLAGLGMLLLAACTSVEPQAAPAPPVAVASAPPAPPVPPVDPRIAKADAIFAAYKADQPGGGVVITHHGEVIYERYFGMADIEHRAPVAADTRFHVASVTKQFVAYAAHLLAQEGKLDLDADIRTYLPDLPKYDQPLTTRQLLNHTSGMRDQWGLFMLAGYGFEDVLRQRTALALLRRQRALNFEPGANYEYSNGGYTLAAVVVEKASGKSLRNFLDERVFTPLDMPNTFVLDDVGEIVPNRAFSYSSAAQPRLLRLNYQTWGATSLHSNARDLSKWLQELNRPTKLNAAAVAAMVKPGKLNSGAELPYASGVQVGAIGSHPAISHGGSDAGFRAFVVALPQDDATLAITLNNTGNPSALAQQLGAIYFDLPTMAAPPLIAALTPDTATLQRIAARYAPDYGPTMEIREQEGKLIVGGVPAAFRADGSFTSPSNPTGWMRLAADGRSLVRNRGDGTIETLRRVELAQPTPAHLQALAGAYRSEDVDATYRLEVEGGKLRMTSLYFDPVALQPMDRDYFFGPSFYGSVVKVLRNRSGRVTGFDLSIMGGRLRHVRFDKVG